MTHFNIKNLLEALRVKKLGRTLKKISLQLGLCNYGHFKRLEKSFPDWEIFHTDMHDGGSRSILCFQGNGIRHDIFPIANETFQVNIHIKHHVTLLLSHIC